MKGDRLSTVRSVADDATRIVYGDREGSYGPAEDSFRRIAALWNGYLEEACGLETPLDSADVGRMMILLKVARDAGPASKRDNLVDIAGYALCLEDILYPEGER